jgi:type IV pilus assembly protein PilC
MHSGSFPDFLISMVGAGETSGSLDIIMQRMSDHYAKENKLKNTIKSAMIYPMILLGLCIVIVIFLFTKIMPVFLGMYDDPSTMPFLTKVMKAISDFLINYWFILIALIIGLVFLIRYLLKIPDFRMKVDRMLIKGPGFGPLVTKIYTGRFARTLSNLYSSGIPMVECLEKSSKILGNSYIDKKFEGVIDEVKQGESLSAAITRTEVFEPMFCSVVYVGEEAGALDSILEKTADYYEEESDSAVQRLVSMVEPMLIIFMGVIIAMVVIGIYPALYGSFESLENE